MLDFAGGVTDVLSQPLQLRFSSADGMREHIPDFFADTRSGPWLIDLRPAGRITPRDVNTFAATSPLSRAGTTGW
ncbi:hypothetical protein LWP59_27270 [Amycolatopsis acidiphila]|uniref:Uncharacterized protein n=1 Tax=Amycolatopsis acidiphila TaxID=715473 RepID=A0A558AID7_9PSEU|nr:hypothetical protein [Amycolatopsis acidiphila]TVT24030.1 hypothetical protein FNH06_07405 [Amycolatopsis acidiphila]UIJ57826.1 hypothetical protein LWP59_27270 [Amycolatopsis acidiphila]GHG87885.1 hypothetical protein GCM10017788_61930 [Amycolatopsis acidiphila]